MSPLLITILITLGIFVIGYPFSEKRKDIESETLRNQLKEPVKSTSQLWGFEIISKKARGKDCYIDIKTLYQPTPTILKDVQVTPDFYNNSDCNTIVAFLSDTSTIKR